MLFTNLKNLGNVNFSKNICIDKHFRNPNEIASMAQVVFDSCSSSLMDDMEAKIQKLKEELQVCHLKNQDDRIHPCQMYL